MGDLKIICEKLEIQDSGLIRKAGEYERLARLRLSAAGGIVCSSALPVICVDLAAGILALPFNFESALRLAAVKKNVYSKNKHIIEKLLNIQAPITVSSLCNILECGKVTEIAEKLLKRFQETSKQNIDYSHPQYICMAVYQATKVEKVSFIAKSKFLTHSHLKLSQWNELDTQWRELVNEFMTQNNTKKKTSPKKKNKNEIAAIAEKESTETVHDDGMDEEVEKYEDYEIWKQRILEEAYKELEILEPSAADECFGKLNIFSKNDLKKKKHITIDTTDGIFLSLN